MLNVKRTVIQVDNTTLAGAGRAVYRGSATLGGQHADGYYRDRPDAIQDDVRSLAELLTAIVLFDEIRWDGSSCVQDSPEMPDALSPWSDAWVYSWFPAFNATEDGKRIIEPVTFGRSDKLVELSIDLVLRWLDAQRSSIASSLPPGFRTPQAYRRSDYHDRRSFEARRSQYPSLSDEDIALAMFLHRGVFYQSYALSTEGVCYLPHSYRSILLGAAGGHILGCLAAYYRQTKMGFDAQNIVEAVSKIVFDAATALHVLPPLVDTPIRSIGAAFLAMFQDPEAALMEALEFRDTAPGQALRTQLLELILTASSRGIPATLPARRQIARDIAHTTLHRFGASAVGDLTSQNLLLAQLGPVEKPLQAILRVLPEATQAKITKALYTPFSEPSGFQLLFSYYFPDTGPYVPQ
jgi:hypothetical protein